jgi:hypothetical protein
MSEEEEYSEWDQIVELPDDAVLVDKYEGDTFTGYHFSAKTGRFYRDIDDTGGSVRALQPCYSSRCGTPYVCCIDDDGECRHIVIRQWRLRHGLPDVEGHLV